MKLIPDLIIAVLLLSNTVVISLTTHHHHHHHLTHNELFRRQAVTADDCTIDDCVVDDECITEESYNTGTLDSCFFETLQVGFNESIVTVEEDAGVVTLIVDINQNALVTMPITVMYSTSEAIGMANTATSNVDYTPVNGQVVFAVGEYTKNITIPIIADSEREEEEIFNVELTTDCCADVIIGQVQINITDDDDCMFDDCISDEGCITEESYYAGTFDSCFVETLQVGFTESAVVISEDVGMVTLTIEINQNSWMFQPVTVAYITLEASGVTNAATSNVDYTSVNGQVVFAVGEYTKNITIPIIADSEREEEEIFNVELTTNCCADVIIGQVQVNITDGTCAIDSCVVDDECITEDSYSARTFHSCFIIESLQVGFTQSMVEVREALGMVTLTIELDQNSWVTRPVTFTYSTSEAVEAPNAATSSVDYAPVSGQVEFVDGEFSKNITIPIIVDSEAEARETFDVKLAFDCCDNDVIVGQVQVNIFDNNIIDFGSTTSVTNVQSSTISNVTTVIQSSPSQSVNTTANESTNNNNSTTVAIIAAVAGSLLVLCIIGICILAIMVKKRRNRSNQKMKHLEFSASAVAMQNSLYKDTFEMQNLTKSYMKTLKQDCKDLQELLLPADTVKFTEVIGEGEFGIVYKGIWTHQNATTEEKVSDVVALKSIKNYDSIETFKSFLHESNTMKKFDHPNVLSIFGVCLENDHEAGVPFIVLPFMVNGDLKSYLKDHRTKPESVNQLPKGLKQHDLLDMCYQIACGMNYLALRRFVHRDLAARNCMVDESLNIKVADFGLARDIYMMDYYRQQSTGKVPVKWMAPEALNDKISNEKTDVWSYGITCWEVFSLGRTPYPTVSNYEILRHVEEGNRPDQPVLCPDNMYSLMLKCLELDANSRLNFKEIEEELSNLIAAVEV